MYVNALHFKILRTDSLQILIIIFVLIIEMKKKQPLITVRFVNIFCMYMYIIYR